MTRYRARRVFVRRLSAGRSIGQFSPVMAAVKKFAAEGKFVFGICNGFQILCESRAFARCVDAKRGSAFCLPAREYPRRKYRIRHSRPSLKPAGSFRFRSPTPKAITSATTRRINSLEENGQIVFRYCDENGEVTAECESERARVKYRRHLQPGAKRPRNDAAPRACLRGTARIERRPRHFSFAGKSDIGRRSKGLGKTMLKMPRYAEARAK